MTTNTTTILNYNANGRYTANEAIDNFILGDKARIYRHEYINDDSCPRCDMEKHIIYSPVLPSMLNNEMDMIIRGKNEHEAGHARFTPTNKKPNWSKVKCNLINALEDQRIERGVKTLSKAFENDLNFLNKHYIDKINNNYVNNGVNCKPVNEAIMALHMKECGIMPKWNLTSIARKLYDVAEPIFAEWINADYKSPLGFDLIENITDRIIAEWEKINNGEKQEDNEEEGENEEQEKNNKEQEKNNKENGNNKKQENDEEQENDGDNGNDGDDGEQGENGKQGNDGKNGNDEKQGNNREQGENGKQGNDGEQGENGNDGDNVNDKENGNDEEQGNKGKKQGNGRINKIVNLDDICDESNEIENLMEKEIKEMIDNSKKELGNYNPYTKEDEIIKSIKDKIEFEAAYREIAGGISTFAGYMEQSLRSLSRCRKIENRDRGYLNVNSLPMVAKNLTKNAFYNKKKGVSLDTTVSILLDESGSMHNSISHCRSLAIAMAEVLERLGIKFEILGHTTKYPTNLSNSVRMLFNRILPMILFEHKTFNESYRNEKYRLGSINARSGNIDGEALLATFKRCIEQKSNRHIILVISDGEPSGTLDFELGERHLKMVVDYCRKNNAEVYAFGIGTESPKKYYGKENFVFLKSIKEMNSHFFRQLSNIITFGSMVK